MLDSDLPLSTPIVDQNILDETPVITYTNMLPIESLIYDDTIDTSTIQNVILIDSTVIDFQLYNNVNTFPIVYSRMSTREQLLEILTSKFQNIVAFGFFSVWYITESKMDELLHTIT